MKGRLGNQIHNPNNYSYQQGGYQYNNGRLLQLHPGRPGYLFNQLPVCLFEVCCYFVHYNYLIMYQLAHYDIDTLATENKHGH